MITRIKVCGITSADDAKAAVRLGADALGLIFYEKSPRFVTIEQAQAIAAAVNPLVPLVAVFVDASKKYVNSILKQVPIHILQFHGKETAAYCTSFGRPYFKAIAMTNDLEIANNIALHKAADCLLFDTATANKVGGTGKTFDLDLFPNNIQQKTIIAGGINSENVKSILTKVAVDAVDLNSGVESSPGVKDYSLLAAAIVQIKTNQIQKMQRQFETVA